MLSAIVLICSATLHDCTLDNATVVMRLRVESGSPAACLMHTQEVMAQTNQPRARRDKAVIRRARHSMRRLKSRARTVSGEHDGL
jgi:hypothetical protein